ncbi:BnaA09g02370D [Brassica napus]|uniref:BnaA09g02370D protein n=2 Tax=Brassica napus TaxID=3708 RepID=A0A078G3P7_BRANA|nr:BnaA09g02370D [Brassica napus]
MLNSGIKCFHNEPKSGWSKPRASKQRICTSNYILLSFQTIIKSKLFQYLLYSYIVHRSLYSYPFSLLIDFYSSIVSEKLQTAQCEVLL